MLSTFIFAVSLLVSTVFAQQLCNGYAEFCTRSYGNITFIGAHDSAFVSTTDAVTCNQHYDVTRQLDDGIRMLQSQGHHPLNGTTTEGNIELCHTNCEIFDGGSLVSYLQKVKSWLDANPDEVLTFLFTNDDDISVTTWAADFETAGIANLTYVPTFTSAPGYTSDWPTLGSMISSGTRVVIFMDSYADTAEVDYILPEFTFMWETEFDQTNSSFPCTVNRPASLVGQVPTGMLSTVNHFLDSEIGGSILIPDTSALTTTNGISGAGSLGQQIFDCAALYGVYPNFLLVDYYDVYNGSVFKVAAEANGVTYIPSASVLEGTENNSTSNNVASSATVKKVMPIFIILQLAFSGLTIAGAFWLAWEGDLSKYERQTDQYTTLIPAPANKGHQKHDSIASVGSEAAFEAVELETGGFARGHLRTDSTADLTATAALMGTSTPRRLSIDSSHSLDDHHDFDSLQRVLASTQQSRGYLEGRRNSLFLD